MKILHVIPSMAVQSGGPAFALSGLIRSSRILEIESRVLTTDFLTPASSPSPKFGATVHDFPADLDASDIHISPVKMPVRFAFSPDLLITSLIESGRVDLIHIHSANLFPQLAAWLASQVARKPYIITPHGTLDPWVRSNKSKMKALNDLLW